ncbi:MAG: 1-deoxy-D-xylulose-5-phosphate synthase [Treponema sp.]|nr:1-deoxy-D-xylulose-5-phosphate synthase [Treponema sp.]
MYCAVFFFGEGSFTILSSINSPKDLKQIPESQLPELSEEIRKKILAVVAKNGGHLASNLGVVELTIALHRVFSSPEDAIIFDVSHQCYAHKLLTGRYGQFDTLRKHGGISGFTRTQESEHDYFDNGHSSASVSQALGLLTAWNLQDKAGKVVAVIGDGALTGGMAFEALCHAGQLSKKLIVVLNDNQMSISPNNGSLSRYLSRLTMTRTYQTFRYRIDHLVDKLPNSERHLGKFIIRFKRALKGFLLSNNLFSDLGFEYVGPLDGHNIPELEQVFRRVRNLPKPVVVHVRTTKGKGYSPAENDPATFHGIGPFQISDGTFEKFDTLSFTESFSHALISLAEKNPHIAAITAAMAKGTGLDAFSRRFSERFFDVGIAEEHAVTFAGGLAAGGMVPVVAIYSTFIQRAVDQIIHDVALSSRGVVLCFDRAGVVPNDSETHQGLFDIALLRSVPNLTILAPASAKDLERCLAWAVELKKPVAIRYPKMSCPSETDAFASPVEIGRGLLVRAEDVVPTLAAEDVQKKVLFVTTGGFYTETVQAVRSLAMEEIYADIYSLRFIKPLDENYLVSLAEKYAAVVLAEDGVALGGVSEYIQNVLFSRGITNIAVKAFPDAFLSHGTRDEICSDAHMSPRDLAGAAKRLLQGVQDKNCLK